LVILSGQEDEALAIGALHQGACQDYLVKDDIVGSQLERVMRYAIERPSLAAFAGDEAGRQAAGNSRTASFPHVFATSSERPLTCIPHQFVTILLDGLAGEEN